MRRNDWERFDRARVDLFLRLLGAALLACVATDAVFGFFRVEAGDLFPWRHLPGIPLYGIAGLVVEWLVTILGGISLLVGVRRRVGVFLGIAGTLAALSQRYSNHRALLLIVLVFVVIETPDVGEAASASAFAPRPRPNLALVRVELLLVYASSAIGKIAHGFWRGEALHALFGWDMLARIASPLVVVAEIAAPLLLLTRPRIGFACVVALHAAKANLLPSDVPFSQTMVAMAVLFLDQKPVRAGRAPASARVQGST